MQTSQTTSQSKRDSHLNLVRKPSIGLIPRQIITSWVETNVPESSTEGVVVFRTEPSADDHGDP